MSAVIPCASRRSVMTRGGRESIWPCESRISNFEVRDLVDVRTGPLDQLLPGFQNRADLVFENITDRDPHPVLLGGDQLDQSPFKNGRKFRAGNFYIGRFGPSKVFGKNRVEDSNVVKKLSKPVISFFFLTVFQKANDFAG